MNLTKKQEEGLKIAIKNYQLGYPYTVISGYAGSGKTTLVKHIVEALNFKPENVAYIAYTGKAAQVLKQKGNPNACTAHKLLYKAKSMPDGTYKFFPRDMLEKRYDMIVVDEVSMLPKTMWHLLLSHGVYVLACGDPGQLPVINKEEDNHILDNPNIFLDEIMRQAAESEIIRLSQWIREGKSLETFQCSNDEVKIFDKNELVTGMYTWADQIICATNKNRRAINKLVHSLKGFDDNNLTGAKVVSLHNQWEFFDKTNSEPLVNGTTGNIQYYYTEPVRFPNYITNKTIEYLFADVISDDGYEYSMIPMEYKQITTGFSDLDNKIRYKMFNNKKVLPPPFEFDLGYCLSCWKAQGDQWNKVLGFEEKFPFDKEEHKRYLYTLCTRAIDKLVLIKA